MNSPNDLQQSGLTRASPQDAARERPAGASANLPVSSGQVTPIGHVLVCLDLSAMSDGALPYARFVASAFGAKITLLHVMPSPPAEREPDRLDALDWEIGKREASQHLSRARTALGVSIEDSDTRLTQGLPAEQIVAAARELRVDLTVLSSRGEGSSSAADLTNLGSVAQHVLAMAGGSVLLAPPSSAAHLPPKRILVALDGSLRSESALPVVAGLARLRGSEVLLVHVVTEPTSTAVLADPGDLRLALSLASRMQASAEAYLTKMRARLLAQVPVVKTLVVRRTEDRQALLDVAVETSADMLVVTAHGATCNAERPFGSVVLYVLAHGRLPIFVVQDIPRGQPAPTPGEAARLSLSARPQETV